MTDGRSVAGEFGVAATGDSFSVPSAGEATGSLPVANVSRAFEAKLLIEQKGLNLSGNLQGGNGDFPTGGVGGTAGGFPLIEGSDGEVGGAKGGGLTACWNPSPRGGGVGAVTRIAHAIEH